MSRPIITDEGLDTIGAQQPRYRTFREAIVDGLRAPAGRVQWNPSICHPAYRLANSDVIPRSA